MRWGRGRYEADEVQQRSLTILLDLADLGIICATCTLAGYPHTRHFPPKYSRTLCLIADLTAELSSAAFRLEVLGADMVVVGITIATLGPSLYALRVEQHKQSNNRTIEQSTTSGLHSTTIATELGTCGSRENRSQRNREMYPTPSHWQWGL